MRKLLLIAIIAVSASTAAHAEATRGLTLASATRVEAPAAQPAAQQQLSVADQLKALGEKVPDTQARADAQTVAPAQTTNAAAADVTHATPAAKTAASEKTKRAKAPRRHKQTTEARIRRELGRYGIAW
ncbi:MAG: hypothetical protein R3D69_13720 [Xanthobacteraceae bacterium]